MAEKKTLLKNKSAILLLNNKKKKKIAWAKKHKEWTLDQWKSVLGSNEST